MSVFILAQSVNIHLGDMLQVDSLLEHMELHEDIYGDDLFAFISKHYGGESQEHRRESGSDRDHSKLPFNHTINADSFQFFILDIDQLGLAYTKLPVQKKSDFYYNISYSFLENTDIFQPPRQA